MIASTVADNVSTSAHLLAANSSRKRRCLRAQAPMIASAYSYPLHLDGSIVTLDAMGCQKDIAARIRAKTA